MSLVTRLMIGLVRVYQQVRAGRASTCRYEPSCSAYAAEALGVHGARRGGWLAVCRLSRCHPWGRHGWDPVPLPSGPAMSAADPSSERTAA